LLSNVVTTFVGLQIVFAILATVKNLKIRLDYKQPIVCEAQLAAQLYKQSGL